MPLDWSPLADFVARHPSFLLATHARPDADALGSQLTFAAALVQLGKRVRVVTPTSHRPRYAFVDAGSIPVETFTPPGDLYADCAACVVLDTGTWNQLEPMAAFLKESPMPKAVIDHHRTQDDLGGPAFVDTSAESCARLAYEAAVALGATVTEEMANAAFMGLAMDTGWFRHANTTAATFALAEELVRLGARPTQLHERLFDGVPLARLKLQAKALERLTVVAGGKVAYTEVLREDFAASGAAPGDTEELINAPRSLQGVEVALLFLEQFDGGTKISFRARDTDVSRVAEQFGGGGHRLAAGGRVKRPLAEVRPEVLAAVEAAMG